MDSSVGAFGLLVSLPGSRRLSGAQPGAGSQAAGDRRRRSDALRLPRSHRPALDQRLKRLLTEGAVFEQTSIPYLNTVTCAGHATIGTGASRPTHGIIMNAWWRGTPQCLVHRGRDGPQRGLRAGCRGGRPQRDAVAGADDGRSPARRIARVTRRDVVDEAAQRRHARRPWRRRVTGSTITTCGRPRRPTPTAPDPDGAGLHHRQPARASAAGGAGPASTAAACYTGKDDAPGEAPPRGWTPVFPHPLAGAPGTPPSLFLHSGNGARTPTRFSASMAESLIKGMKLGQGDAVDYLGVSFAALDYVGHEFGPDSHEVQDTLMRLDLSMGALLNALDSQVGRGRYVLGLSADHGVAPDARSAPGWPAKRAAACDAAPAGGREPGARRHARAGPPVVRAEYTQLYLSEAAQQKALENPQLLDPAIATRSNACPAWTACCAEPVSSDSAGRTDPVVRAAALSHVPGRSGRLWSCHSRTTSLAPRPRRYDPRHAASLRSARAAHLLRRAGEARPVSDAFDARRPRADDRGDRRPAACPAPTGSCRAAPSPR